MSLWGCQIGHAFLSCAGTFYTLQQRLLLGAVLIGLVSMGAVILVRRSNPR